jgi:shikimate dehydrogenase
MERKDITGKTRLLGVIGDPVEHSLSPLLHNHVLGKLGLDYLYVPFHVKEAQAGGVGEAMRTLGLAGLNVTIPHKQTVRDQVQQLSDEAEAVSAVNTLGWTADGRLAGHNTDVAGFEKSLVIRGLAGKIKGSKAVILGAGGASRAVLCALVKLEIAKVTIANRTQARAGELAGWFSYRFPWVELALIEIDNTHELGNALADAAITVNVTPRGMTPNVDQSPLPDDLLPPAGSIVYDTIYTPAKTVLLSAAEQAGCIAVNGLDMLIIQGMESLEWWLGREIGWRDMLDELRALLNAALAEK